MQTYRFAGLLAVALMAGCGAVEPERAASEDQANSTEKVTQLDPHGPQERAYEDRHGNISNEIRAAGQVVYDAHCATCHDPGLNRAPQREMLILMTPESIHRALTDGVMQSEAEALSDREKVLVAEYLTERKLGSMDDMPAPVMCEGPALVFDRSEPPVFNGWGLSGGNEHFIPASVAGLNKDNIGTLKLKWAYGFPNAIRARSQPASAGGAIFVGSHNGTVYALDRETGCTRWTFTASAEVRTGIVIDPWQPGDEAARPLAYFGDLIGNIYAVDAFTGALEWRKRMDDHANTTITAAPALHDGTLYVSVSALEVSAAINPDYPCCSFRGSVAALDAATGDEKWRTYTIDVEPSVQGQNASGTDQFGPSGAPVWNTPSIDAKRGQLYFGTGENYSSPATLTSDAIFALDLETGAVKWTFQGTPNDAWNSACENEDKTNCPAENGPDFDFGAGTIITSDSDGRDYVLAGQKSGMQHALDPDTGEVIWQTKVGRGGVRAGIHFGIAAQGDTVFSPVSDLPDSKDHGEEPRPGMYALDMKTGDYLWRAPSENICGDTPFCAPGYSAAVSTTPDLLLAGSIDGHMRIFDTRTGEILWSFDTRREFETINGVPARGGSLGGGSAPIAHDGVLYFNAGYGFSGMMPGNVLLAFEVQPVMDVSEQTEGAE